MKRRRKNKPHAEITPEAQGIVNAWEWILKAKISPQRVADHLAELEECERVKREDLARLVR